MGFGGTVVHYAHACRCCGSQVVGSMGEREGRASARRGVSCPSSATERSAAVDGTAD